MVGLLLELGADFLPSDTVRLSSRLAVDACIHSNDYLAGKYSSWIRHYTRHFLGDMQTL
jgi:hypothetical protein